MEKKYTLLFAFCLGLITSYSQNYQWAKSVGGASNDIGLSITVDGLGNVYTSGVFRGDTVDFDPGAGTSNLIASGLSDIFISKLDALGNYIWAISIGGPSSGEYINSIALDGFGNIYATGSFIDTIDFDPGAGTSNLTSKGSEDIFILKLDTGGNFIWAKSIGGTSNVNSVSIAVDGSGNVYTTGSFQDTVDFDPGAGTSILTSTGISDIFVSKLDAAGNYIWAKSMGGASWDFSTSIAVDGSGNIHTTGIFSDTVDFDPGAGISNLISLGTNDMFISKLDSLGNYLWAKRIGGTVEPLGQDIANSIAVDRSGNVYTTGEFIGNVDFDPGTGSTILTSFLQKDVFILKLDTGGNFIWAKRIGDYYDSNATSIAVDGVGNVYTTGAFRGYVDFDPGTGSTFLTSTGYWDIFILKLDPGGNFIWAKSMGGTSSDGGFSIALDSSSNVYTIGAFGGTVDFDPGVGTSNLTSVGGADIFILKLSPFSVGLLENSFEGILTAYPNPTKGPINIQLNHKYDVATLVIRNLIGQELMKKSYRGSNLLQVNIPGAYGLYFIEINTNNKRAILKVLKN
jgi:hypothetical protein